jgi:acyl-ACP thioesterase
MYEYKVRIGFSECDINKTFTVTSLIDAFQDCSTFQSEDLNVGFDVLTAHNLVWVINYWELDISRLPKLCDYVTVGTFPYDFKGCFGFRNFYLKDANEEFIVKANSMWTLVDTQTLKPTRAPEFISNAYEMEPKLDME